LAPQAILFFDVFEQVDFSDSTVVGHQYDYNQRSPFLTKYLKCDACASTLLPETLDEMMPVWQRSCGCTMDWLDSGSFLDRAQDAA